MLKKRQNPLAGIEVMESVVLLPRSKCLWGVCQNPLAGIEVMESHLRTIQKSGSNWASESPGGD